VIEADAPRAVRAARVLALLAIALGGSPATQAATLTPADCPASRGDPSHEDKCYSAVFGGRKRTLRLYLPTGHSGPEPLVMVLHGHGGTACGMEWMTRRGFNHIADRDGAIVVYPDGIAKGWNDGRSETGAGGDAAVDDVGFLSALPQAIAALHPVDAARVYVTGISNGGLMSYRLACDAAGVFAAAAAVAANMSVELAPRCQPERIVPMLIMDGTDDPIMPWKGGAVRVLWMARGTVISAEASADRWRELDHCAPFESLAALTATPADGTSVLPHVAHCASGAEVRLYEIRGGGHSWPRGVPYLGPLLIGRVSQALDANETIWAFFSQHPLH
jgi:polyhydroxybutyrate depolymerase